MNDLTQVEVIVIGKPPKPPKFVATRTPAVRLVEVIDVANTLAELLTPQEVNGIRLLLKAFGVEIQQ